MAKRKSIIVTSTHSGKRWHLEISATDPEARKKIIRAIMALQSKENGGFLIQNGASPFGDEPETEPAKEQEKKQETFEL